MTLRTCCVLFALGLLAAAPARPNVLVIVADDHAAYVAGCYGNSAVHTPNIDRLAAQGTLFTRAYCNAPVCTASRQSFLTGKLPHSVGVTLLPTRLGDDQTTLAEHLKRAGYETAALGKMHFNGPSRHGFDERIDLPEFRRQQRAHPPRAVPSDTAVLPAWKPFTAADRATLVFDRECKAVNDPHGSERLALEAIRERAGGR